MRPPDQKLRRAYEAECDCGWWKDGHHRTALVRALAKHHETCAATIRLHRIVTVVWREKGGQP